MSNLIHHLVQLLRRHKLMFPRFLLVLVLAAPANANPSLSLARYIAAVLMNDAVMQITKGEEIIFVHYIYT